MIGLHCVCSNLVSYKYKELLKEVFHIKEGQKCGCFYSKVNALCWNKRRQIICSYSALVHQAKPFESTQSHYASCTKSRWTDSRHKLNALIHGKHSAESNSNSTQCSSPCSTSLFPHFFTPEKSKGVEPLQGYHTDHLCMIAGWLCSLSTWPTTLRKTLACKDITAVWLHYD